MIIINNLKKLRLRYKLKQIDLCRQLDITPTAYYNYENQITEPDYKTLKKIAEFYNVSIDYLLNYNNPNKEKININIDYDFYNKLIDLTDNIKSKINIENTNLIKGNNNKINIKNSYKK